MRRTGLVWWMRVAIRWASNCGRVRGGTPEHGYADGVAVSIRSRGLSAEVRGGVAGARKCGRGPPRHAPTTWLEDHPEAVAVYFPLGGHARAGGASALETTRRLAPQGLSGHGSPAAEPQGRVDSRSWGGGCCRSPALGGVRPPPGTNPANRPHAGPRGRGRLCRRGRRVRRGRA